MITRRRSSHRSEANDPGLALPRGRGHVAARGQRRNRQEDVVVTEVLMGDNLVEEEVLGYGGGAQRQVVDEVLVHEQEDPGQRAPQDVSHLLMPRYSLLDLDQTIDISDDEIVDHQEVGPEPGSIPLSPLSRRPGSDSGGEGNETIQVLDNSLDEFRGRTSWRRQPILVDIDQSSPTSRIHLDDQSVIVISDSPPVSLRDEELESANPDAEESFSVPTCPICLVAFKSIKKSGVELLSTVCGHIFCGGCLKQCLRQSQQCPVCRAEITRESYHPIFF